MRIFFLSPNQIDRYNWGWQLFRNEMAKQHEVVFYGEGYPNHNGYYVPSEVERTKPFALMMFGDCKNLGEYDGIDEIILPKVAMLGDYFDYYPHRQNYYLERNNIFINRNGIDVICTTSLYELDVFNKCKKSGYFKKNVMGLLNNYSVDTNVFKNLGLEKDIDVSAIYNHFAQWCYPSRWKIKKMIMEMSDLSVLIGDKKSGPIHHEYVKAINRSKIFVGNCNIFGNASWKIPESLACGTFMLSDKPYDGESLGYKDGKHLVYYETIEDLKEKIYYYSNHEGEREKIAQQGMEFVRANHSNKIRAKQLFQQLREVL